MAGPIRIAILADARPAQQGMKKVEESATGMGSKLSSVGAGIRGGFAAIGATVAAVGAVEGFKQVIDQAADLNAAIGATQQVFGSASKSMLDWSKTAASTLGLSQSEALDATKTFGGFFTAIGMGNKQAATMSKSWATMAANLAAFGDMPTADAIDAVTGALRGEYDPLQRYIPTMSDAAIKQKAMAMSGVKNANALTQQQKAAAINALIMGSVANKAGAAERKQAGYAVQMDRLKAQVKDSAAALGTIFLPALTSGMKFLNETALPAVKKFTSFIGPLLKSGISVGTKFLQSTAMPAVKKFVDFIGPKLKAGLTGLSKFKPPKGIVDIAKSKEATYAIDQIKAGFASLGPVISRAIAVVSPIIAQVAHTLGTAFNKAVPAIKNVVQTIGQIISRVFELIRVIVTMVLDLIQIAWKNFGSNILSFISSAFAAIVQVFQGAFNVIKGIFDIIIGIFTGDWSRVWQGVTTVVSGAWQIIQGIFGYMKAGVALLAAIIGKLLAAGWGQLKSIAVTAWRAVLSAVMAVWNAIKAGISAAVRFVGAVVAATWNGIKAATMFVWNAIKSFISLWWSGIKIIISAAIGVVKGVFTGAWNAIKTATSAAWNGIKAAVSAGIDGVVNFVKGLAGRVTGAVSGAATWLYETGKDVINGFIGGVGDMIGQAIQVVTNLSSSVISTVKHMFGISSPSKVFADIGKALGYGFIEGVTSTIPKITKTMQKLSDLVTKAFSGKKESTWLARIRSDTTALIKLANERAAVVRKLDAQQARLKDLVSARKDVVSGIRDTFAQAFTLVDQAAQDGDVSLQSILDRSAQAAQQAIDFAQQLADLRKAGLSPAILQELANAGPQAGSATAKALLAGSADQLAQLKDNYQQIADAGKAASNTVGDAMYGAGIAAAEALVRGLQAKQAAIDAQMRAIAARLKAGLQAAIKVPVAKPPAKAPAGKAAAASYAATSAAPAVIHMTVNTGVIVDKRGLVDTISAAVNEVAAQLGRPIQMAVTT